MPQRIREKRKNLSKCSWCGKLITAEPITVKTCCVNTPWYFCSNTCYKQFVVKWTKNQDALSKNKSSLKKGAF
uniref:TRASH domain-containing protein n=1 Tax=Caldimicrobium thiodismutans TaxID=1653476 RepID=A0A832GQ96_9BACT